MKEEQKNLNKIKIFILIVFITVPILSSLISTIHLIDLFLLGNTLFLSLLLAITFEIGSIAAFITPFVFKRINRNLIFSIFGILIFIQILGNLYYSFHYINIQLKNYPGWLESANELFGYFLGEDVQLIKIILASLISVFIPLISLFFLKSIIDYLDPEQFENLREDLFLSKKNTIIKDNGSKLSNKVIQVETDFNTNPSRKDEKTTKFNTKIPKLEHIKTQIPIAIPITGLKDKVKQESKVEEENKEQTIYKKDKTLHPVHLANLNLR